MSVPGQAAFTGRVSAKVARSADEGSRPVAYEVISAADVRTHWCGSGAWGPMAHAATREAAADGGTAVWNAPVSDAAYDGYQTMMGKGTL